MKKLLILTILCGLFSCNGNATPPDNGELPGKKTMSVIKKAEKVVYYALDPMTEDFSHGKIQGIAVCGEKIEVPNDKKDSLFSLIQESIANYNLGGASKMSAFIPDCAIQFIKGVDTVNLLLDFHVAMMDFRFKDKKCRLDFDKTHDKFAKLINSLVIKEDSVQKIENATESIVPKEILNNITVADSVVWYILDPMDRAGENDETFNGTLVLQEKGVKDATEVSSLLSSSKSFTKSDVLKDCIFFPDLGIRMYVNGTQTVDVMFSFYCNECKIINGETRFQSDCQIIIKEIIGYFRNVFPKDRYLRVLSNQ